MDISSQRSRRSYPLFRRTFSSRSTRHSRRGGQALLLAVLLMVFAALLGSTFVTVVALNLNQTARQAGKNDARLAADAGMRLVNEQLVNNGENWRPEQVSPPPASGDADYNSYYTEFDKAQGWARSVPHATTQDNNSAAGVSNGDWDKDGVFDAIKDDWAKLEYYKNLPSPDNARVYVKFPDPRQLSSGSSPTYLAEVTSINPDPDPAKKNRPQYGDDQQGLLEISVIGLASDNETTFARVTAYKGSAKNGSPFSFALYTGNYDTQTNRLATGKLTQATVAATSVAPTVTMTLQERLTVEPGRSVMLRSGASSSSAIVQSVSGDGKTITVKGLDGLLPAFAARSEVRAIGSLTDGLIGSQTSSLLQANFDADGDKVSNGTHETTNEPVRNASTTRGVYFGGGARVADRAALTLPATGAALNVVGSLDLMATDATSATISDGTTKTAMASSPQVRTDADPTNPVRPIAPPTLSASNERYLQLTKYAVDQGQYGLGPGLYIDNPNDIEKVATATGYRTLKNFEMQRLWQRKSFPTVAGDSAGNADKGKTGAITNAIKDAFRLSHPRLGTDTYTYPMATGSLEQIGKRGWISPTEFRPRGVQIELQGNTIIVTRDRRSDALPNEDISKVWRKVNGDPINIPNSDNYRMKLTIAANGTVTRTYGLGGAEVAVGGDDPINDPQVFNGVIYAEGNVRIRGYLGTKDLTVVSQGNIYVDGSIVRNSARIALLAKRNVILNPTQVVPDVVGRSGAVRTITPPITTSGSAAKGATSITLNLGTNTILVGDKLQISGVGSAYYAVTAVSGSNITISPGLARRSKSNRSVTIKFAGSTPGTTALLVAGTTNNQYFYSVGINPTTGPETVVRDVKFDGVFGNVAPPLPYYLSVLHSGESKKAVDLTMAGLADTPYVRIKEDADASTFIGSAEKKLEATASATHNFSYDLLEIPGTAGNSRGEDDIQSLATLVTRFNSDQYPSLVTSRKWQMTNPDANAATIAARRLASIGTTAGTTDDTLAALGTPIRIPLTVSAAMFWQKDITATGMTPNATIGSSFEWAAISDLSYPIATQDDPLLYEQPATTRASFYQRDSAGTQAALQWYTFPTTLTANAVPDVTGNTNILTFLPNNAPGLPIYRLADVRIERDPFTAPAAGATRAYTPGMEIKIQATIFAESGSWFVVPLPLRDTSLDGDTTVSNAEKAAATRFRRLDYSFAVTGNIVQAFSPTDEVDYDSEQDPDGNARGAMRSWIDGLSYPTKIENDAQGNGRGRDWQSITYTADPIPANTKLALPVSPDLIFAS